MTVTAADGFMKPAVQQWRWWWLAAALLLLDIVKHGLLIAAGQTQPWGDSTVYWRMGAAVANGDWWLATDPVAYRTPGYPWFLGLLRNLFGTGALFAVVVAQHLCVVLTSVLTAAMTWKLTGSRHWGLVAWAGCVLSTARPLYANWLLTESLATVLLTAGLLFLLMTVHNDCRKWLAWAGLVLGLGVLVRPSLVAAVPALLLAGFWVSKRSQLSPRQRLGLLAAGPLVFALVLAPWCARNQRLFDRFTLCIFTGRELWTAHFSPWPGGELDLPQDGPARELWLRVNPELINTRHQWSVSNALVESGLNDAEADGVMERVAQQAIGRQFGRAAYRTLARCATFWYCWEWPTDLREDPLPEQKSGLYADQFRWRCSVIQPAVIDLLPYTPERWKVTSVLWSCLTWLGLAVLLVRSPTRSAAILLGSVLVMATLLTAALEIPLYRYRCVLEPLMLAVVVSAVASLWNAKRTA